MDLLIYLAKASLILTLFWVVYKLVLEDETYHRFKRIYLLAGYVISLILPLFTYTQIEEITLSTSNFLPSSSEFVPVDISRSPLELFWGFVTEHSILELMYLWISLVFVVHLGLKFFKLLGFLKRSRVLKSNGSLLIEKAIPEGAFSFLNYIVYNPDLYSEEELNIILAHEQAHVHKKHSLDILFAHVYKCFFWFNPFAWLYQKSLALNLEYEADAKVVNTTAKRDFQMTLYSITQHHYKHQLQHSFYQSPIKKRIAMLNKNKHNSSLWKLFTVSPLLVIFFLLFQVETKAQIKEAEPTSESKITKVEITYDENTTREELNSDREFLKEEFNIDMSYSKLRFSSEGKLEAITLDVDCNDGFKGSVTSPDVEKLPVYFYRDYSEGVKKPFGVGTKRDSEHLALPESESLKDIETFIVNEQKIKKDDLLDKYIPVKRYNHMEDSNTLYITTRSEFSKPYYDRMFEAKDELNALFEQGELEGVVYFKVEKDNIVFMIINNFELTKTPENTSQYTNSSLSLIKKKASLSDLSQDSKEFLKMDGVNFTTDFIFIIDGVKAKKGEPVNIDTDQIESVDIVKAADKLKAEGYDANFVNGLIYITTKKQQDTSQKKASKINGKGSIKINNNQVIYILDGKELEDDEIKNIDPKDIQSMVVVKSRIDIKKAGYDPDEVDGLIKIRTKSKDAEKTIKIKNK